MTFFILFIFQLRLISRDVHLCLISEWIVMVLCLLLDLCELQYLAHAIQFSVFLEFTTSAVLISYSFRSSRREEILINGCQSSNLCWVIVQIWDHGFSSLAVHLLRLGLPRHPKSLYNLVRCVWWGSVNRLLVNCWSYHRLTWLILNVIKNEGCSKVWNWWICKLMDGYDKILDDLLIFTMTKNHKSSKEENPE